MQQLAETLKTPTRNGKVPRHFVFRLAWVWRAGPRNHLCVWLQQRSHADTLPSGSHWESKNEHAHGLSSWRLCCLHPPTNRQGPPRMQIEIFDPFRALLRGNPNEGHLEQRRVVLLCAEGPFKPSE